MAILHLHFLKTSQMKSIEDVVTKRAACVEFMKINLRLIPNGLAFVVKMVMNYHSHLNQIHWDKNEIFFEMKHSRHTELKQKSDNKNERNKAPITDFRTIFKRTGDDDAVQNTVLLIKIIANPIDG